MQKGGRRDQKRARLGCTKLLEVQGTDLQLQSFKKDEGKALSSRGRTKVDRKGQVERKKMREKQHKKEEKDGVNHVP